MEDFIKNFRKEYSREPTNDEIYENLKEQVAQDIVNKVVARLAPESNNVKVSKTASMFRNALGAISLSKTMGQELEPTPKV